jgi:hypothetical protein
MSHISVPVSVGELLDKLTILEIKSERIDDPEKLENVERELKLLRSAWAQSDLQQIDIRSLLAELRAVNEKLWIIEDDIRQKELDHSFDAKFVELARSVYLENDRRARIKRQISETTGSDLVEEKHHPA